MSACVSIFFSLVLCMENNWLMFCFFFPKKKCEKNEIPKILTKQTKLEKNDIHCANHNHDLSKISARVKIYRSDIHSFCSMLDIQSKCYIFIGFSVLRYNFIFFLFSLFPFHSISLIKWPFKNHRINFGIRFFENWRGKYQNAIKMCVNDVC